MNTKSSVKKPFKMSVASDYEARPKLKLDPNQQKMPQQVATDVSAYSGYSSYSDLEKESITLQTIKPLHYNDEDKTLMDLNRQLGGPRSKANTITSIKM